MTSSDNDSEQDLQHTYEDIMPYTAGRIRSLSSVDTVATDVTTCDELHVGAADSAALDDIVYVYMEQGQVYTDDTGGDTCCRDTTTDESATSPSPGLSRHTNDEPRATFSL